MVAARVLRRRVGLTVAVAGLLAVGTVAVVVELQMRADSQRQAQVRLGTVETAVEKLATVPLVALYVGTDQSRLQLAQSRESVNAELTALDRTAPNRYLPRIRKASAVFAADLDNIVGLIVIFKEQQAGASVASLPDPSLLPGYKGIERRFQQEHDGIVETVRAASTDYSRAASRATIEAHAGSALAILLAFVGFVVMLRSLAGARRKAEQALSRAEALAVENERLLDAATVEAQTDPLTGLANRRKLMKDLGEATDSLGEGERLLLAVFDLDGFKRYNDEFGHPAGDQLLIRLGRELDTAVARWGTAYRLGGDEFCTICRLDQDDDSDSIRESAADALRERGDGFSISCSHGAVVLPRETRNAEQAFQLADQRLYAHKTFSPLRGPRQARDVLLQALVERSPDLGAHLTRVADLSELLARRLGLDDDEIARIRLGAELHDIGKVAIPESIMDKPASLTDEEWLLIKQHTLIGERIVAAGSTLQDVAQMIRGSHERIDGIGYPDGIAGDRIPLGSRIIAVCDAYDAMLTDRPYQGAKTSEEALAELEINAGTQFDREVVAAFAALARAGSTLAELAA